ncbi:MAG TPA: formate/nitrite transporter family protein [Mycobacteriales bacterium]|nr:formate/nitrite transporter family protein [Mycobacteriales bacterium]
MVDTETEQPAPADQTPEAGFDRTLEEGKRRLGRGVSALFATGFVGGVDVATGVLAFLIVLAATRSDVLAGLAFPIGFIALTLAGSELFTENFLVPVIAVVARQAPWWRLFWLWAGTLVFNLIGGWIVTGLIIAGFPNLAATAVHSGAAYVGFGLGWRAFSLALLGGLVITLMTWMQHTSEAMTAKIVAAFAAAFLLGAGKLNHAIVASLMMFAALHTGHAPFGYLSWLEAAGWAALGNLVGGVGLVTLLRLLQGPHQVLSQRASPGEHVTDPG